MLRGIFMPPGVTPEQQAFYVDLMNKVRATPDWKEFMEKGAFNQTALAGADYVKWLTNAEILHRNLMTEAGFLAK
jgi:tripartite-type tricarboxylate transporter receptor subunit TctC